MHFKILVSILHTILLAQFIINDVSGQTASIQGTINDPEGSPLFGAAVVVIGQNKGTTSDADGQYKIPIDEGTYQLSISYLGYISEKIEVTVNKEIVNISTTLRPDILQMEEVIVSAGFNEKSKLESSVSVSTLKAAEIEALNPVSALEVLKTVPGLYVNDANGEVGVEIQGRGLSTPFFSLQEDGLPSSISEMASNEKFTRDMFLRNDIMTQRVEAVRGGSASIIAANAPGGVVNYISRTGTDNLELDFRNRFGVQAKGQELYNKCELFIGGPLANTGWNFGVGGHLRYDGGNRKSNFPHSEGGQLKFNFTNILNDNLSVKIFGKYLNDRVGFNRPMFATNWNNIQSAPGFDFDDNVVLPDVAFSMIDGFRINEDPNAFKQIRSRDQQKVKDKSIGLQLQYSIKDNWNVKSITRYSDKSLVVNHIAEEGGLSTIAPDGLFARLFANFDLYFTDLAPMTYGDFQFYDIQTGETLASINTENLARSRPPVINENNLPGNGELFWSLVNNDELEIEEFIQQVIMSGQINNHNLTFGAYYSLAKNNRVLNSATTFLTVEKEPRLLGVRVDMADFERLSAFIPELLPVSGIGNQRAIFNDPSGLHGYNTQVNEYNDLDERTISFFINNEWIVSDKLNVDLGVRYELINHSGRSGITEVQDERNEVGGLDGNILTVSDNIYEAFSGEYYDFDIDYDGLSYSAGINYKLNSRAAIYGRYSYSEKLLNAIYVQDNFIDGQPLEFQPREVSQAEIGLKYTGDQFGLFAVGYRSAENNIFNQLLVVSLGLPDGFYLTPPLFNSVVYYGAELELNYAPTTWWTMRNILNVSGGTNQDFKVWNTGPTDAQSDDVLIDLSGQAVAGSTANKFDISPIDITSTFSFHNRRGSFLINYRRFAERFANSQQAFTLPAFGLWKLGVSYHLTSNITTSLNVNNVLNEIGILRFNGTNDVAGFPENVTTDYIEQNPEQWFKVQRSLGRALYFTMSYSIN